MDTLEGGFALLSIIISGTPATHRASGLDFSAIGGKIQRHGSALIGAGVTGCNALGLKTPNDGIAA